jgi:tetratricopeptide (TPR) repeat protein
MVVALAGLWERQGRFREGRAYLTRCLERQTEIQDRSCIAVLLGKAGWFAYQEQDYSAACEQAERKLALCRDLGNAAGESSALNDLALIAQAQGYVTEAWERFEQALDLARSLGDEPQQAARLSNLGLLAIQENRFAEADMFLQEAQNLYERQNDPHGTAVCLCNLSELALRRGDSAEAERLASESLRRFRRVSDQPGIAYTLANLAEAAMLRGDQDLARQRIEEALAICAEIGMDWLVETLREMRARNSANEVTVVAARPATMA